MRNLFFILFLVTVGRLAGAGELSLTECDSSQKSWESIAAPKSTITAQVQDGDLSLLFKVFDSLGKVKKLWKTSEMMDRIESCFYITWDTRQYLGVVLGTGAHSSQLVILDFTCAAACKGGFLVHSSPLSARGVQVVEENGRLSITYTKDTMDKYNPEQDFSYIWPPAPKNRHKN